MTTTAKRNITEMETYSGRYVDLLNPQPDQIALVDIASGLAKTCRFAGQVSRWYSVAEHSVRCAERAATAVKLPALFHDAHEAYTGDITSPMKRALGPELEAMQDRLDEAIAAQFGMRTWQFKDQRVKAVDAEMLLREAAGLKYSHGIGEHWGNDTYYEPLAAYGWSPDEAERRFIETYERLTA